MSRGRTSSGLRLQGRPFGSTSSPARRRESAVATGGQRELVGSQQSTQFYVKVPVSAISKPGVARFIVSITLSDGRVIERKTSSVDMQTELKDLSTASMNTAEGQAQHERENIILNQVLKNFPLQNPSEWRLDLGSPYHHNQEYYAADLNNGAGSHDEGMEVRAIAEGVAHIDIKFGTVVLTHTLKQNGKPDTTWQSEYTHMRIFETTRKNDVDQAIFEIRDVNDAVVGEIAEGQKIAAGSLVGLVGGKGPNGYQDFSPHSHLVVATGGQSIDVRRLLVDALGIRVTATDGGEDGVVRKVNDGQKQFNVAWDAALESWKTDPALGDGNPNLVYDRSAQVSSSSSETPVYWLAWEVDDNNKPIMDVTKLSRIVNKKIRWKDANGSTQEADMWVKSNDSSSVWDPINRKFYKVQLI